MRISTRTKVLALSFMAGLAMVGAIGYALVGPSGLHSRAAGVVTASYAGTNGAAKVVAQGKNWLGTLKAAPKQAITQKPKMMPLHVVKPTGSGSSALSRPPHAMGLAAPATLEGGLKQNWEGVSDTDSAIVNGFFDTPPDQGLCVGWYGLVPTSFKVSIDLVNSAIGVYNSAGTLLAGAPLIAAFGDPNAFSDPRCFYDMEQGVFYFTVISFDLFGNSVTDLTVVHPNGFFVTFQIPTSEGGLCFGDQPKTGYDHYAIYTSTDQFCISPAFAGSLLWGISKLCVVQFPVLPPVCGGGIPAKVYGNLSLGGIPVLGQQPAFGNDAAHGTEYLLNSFPYDKFGNNNSVATTLGFWTVTNDQAITTGGAAPLTGQVISSEQYAFPMPAASTGNGAVCGGCPPFVISEQFLNPDDSRMQQVEAVFDEHTNSVQLYAAVDTALAIGTDPTARDGVAWFVLNPATKSVSKQGYVGVAGAYLLYPAILHTQEGTTAMVFTYTSETFNPSAAYTVWPSFASGFGPVHSAAVGVTSHISFSDLLFARARWGDYSAGTIDPNFQDLWFATEYIGAAANSNVIDNWGTRVFAMAGDPES
jgi:hypothetical protein